MKAPKGRQRKLIPVETNEFLQIPTETRLEQHPVARERLAFQNVHKSSGEDGRR